MADNLGTDVTIVLDPKDTAYQLLVWQRNMPPTDAELNLVGQINNEERAKNIRALMPSGFIGAPNLAHQDWHFHTSFSNYLFFGRQKEVVTDTASNETAGLEPITWANVNGWMIPVVGTNVNEELTLNDDDFRNKILLPYGPTSGFETNFVFLEVWKKLITVNSSTEGKPSATGIYKYGNTEFGGTNLTDDLLRADIGAETTKRVQIQYRLRMVDSIDAVSFPTGFEDTANVTARANLTPGDALTLAGAADMAFYPVDGDEGLWRAGDGDPTNGLVSVDGYTYAIPVCMVRRRNRGGWGISTINGGVARTSPPTGYVEGDPVNGCPLTSGELSAAPVSDRPDGMFSDFVTSDDVIDLRAHVQPGAHDYDSILMENLQSLFSNFLQTTPKFTTVGGSQFGTSYLVTDELNNTGTDNASTILIGEPDGTRRLFTDVPMYQGRNLNITAAASKEATSPSFGVDPSKWMPGDIISITHPDSLNGEDYPSQMLTGEIELTYLGHEPVAAGAVASSTSSTLVSTGSFTTFSADSDQWAGWAVEITSGLGQGQQRTITLIDSANQISVDPVWGTNPDTTSNFIIRPPVFVGTAVATTTEMLVTLTSINGETSSSSSTLQTANLQLDLWIDFLMHYPAGQGLSVIPRKVHQINYTNPTSSVLTRLASTSGINYLDVRSLAESPDFANPAASSAAWVEAEAYFDESSKTAVVQPFQRVNVALVPRENATFSPTHAFYSLFDTRYCLEVPKAYLPSLGSHAIPIVAASTGVFHTGLHVWAIDESDASSEVVLNLLGRSDFDDDTFVGNSVLAREDSIAYEALDSGTPDKIGCKVNTVTGGIELPQYIGLGRVIGIFEASDFDTNSIAGTNLLNASIETSNIDPNIWIGRTGTNLDVTFTILPGAITGYAAATEYVVVANLFGFREGFITSNGILAAHEQVTGVDETVTLSVVVPQALPASAIAQITYTRVPYQGSIYDRYEPFGSTTPEPFNNRGLVSPTDLTDLDTALTGYDLGTPFHYEVLATAEFFTSLGTARFSGLAGGRYYDQRNIGNSIPADAPRHETLPLSDVSPDRAGFITRLPLGARYRDADFVGEDLESGSGGGSFFFIGGQGSNPSSEIQDSTRASDALGAGSMITLSQGNISTSTLTQFRVTRGGAGYNQAGDFSGGSLETGNRDIKVGFRGLYCTAMLVRNFKEEAPSNFALPEHVTTNPKVLKGRGGELQMVILTSVVNPVFNVQNLYREQRAVAHISSAGVGEGASAIDRYRCIGRPLTHQPLLVPFMEDDTQVVVPSATARVGMPNLYEVYPRVMSVGDAMTVSGVNLAPVKAADKGNGVEYFIRSRAAGATADWIQLDQWIVDYTDTQVVFRNIGSLGAFDLMARAGDGKVSILEDAFSVGTTQPGVFEVSFLDNFMSYPVGKFPVQALSASEGWSTNHPRAFRVSDAESFIGDRSGLFTGTGRVGTDTAFREISSSAGEFGTDLVNLQFSFKLLSSTIPTGNTFDLKYQSRQGSTYNDLISVTFNPATSFYTITVHNELTGTGDVTILTTTVLDTEWHRVGILVSAGGTTSVSWDLTTVGTGTFSGTTITSGDVVGRFVIDNTGSAANTAVSCYVDRLYATKV